MDKWRAAVNQPDLTRVLVIGTKKKRLIHGRTVVWKLSSSVQLDMSRVSKAKTDIESEQEKIYFVLVCSSAHL